MHIFFLWHGIQSVSHGLWLSQISFLVWLQISLLLHANPHACTFFFFLFFVSFSNTPMIICEPLNFFLYIPFLLWVAKFAVVLEIAFILLDIKDFNLNRPVVKALMEEENENSTKLHTQEDDILRPDCDFEYVLLWSLSPKPWKKMIYTMCSATMASL